MFHESQKVFLACAIGAGIGSFVALEVSAMFCWIGFLLGGLAGYLSYEWKEVIRAIPKAYRGVAGYKFPQHYFAALKWNSVFIFNVCIWLLTFFGCLFVGPYVYDVHQKGQTVDWYTILTGFPFVLVGLWLLTSFVYDTNTFGLFMVREKEGKSGKNLELAEEAKNLSYWTFPPLVIFWHLPRGIIFVARRFPEFAKWFVAGCWLVACEWGSFWKKFLWNFFLLVHSEMRILCSVDAFIGTVIGYFVGSALMGALYGGIVGVFNFLVITELCLKRIWRVIPAPKQKII